MTNLHLVLLGMPSSGKSALLGALQQSASSKEAELQGSLVDLTGELGRLKQANLDEKYQPNRDAVAAYPIQLHAEGGDENVTILDTGGGHAKALLTGSDDLGGSDPVPQAVAEADGVLIVVDASAPSDDLDKQFKQCIAFLRTLEKYRSGRSEVAGLPVFLVLSKCDRIARKGENLAQWMQRLEEAKRRVGDQFKQAHAKSGSLPFGRLDVRVWATAVKRPPGVDKPGRANEPYQVAELFGQVFSAARQFRNRADQSHQVLHAALVGLGGLVALLGLLIAWYVLTQPRADEAELENQVQTLLSGTTDNPSEQVREPIEDRLKELRAVKENPAFAHLPSQTQEQIKTTENAIESYQRLNNDFQKQVRNPRLALREADLIPIEKSLAEFDIVLEKWPETRLAKRQLEWKSEAAAIRQALADEETWIRGQIQEGEKLRSQAGLVIAKQVDAVGRDAWFAKVHEYQLRPRRHKSTDRLPGTTVPYRVVHQIDRYEAVEREWRQFKDRLEKLREEALEGAK